ncbi:hypothetical protein [Synechococcus sp. PCC 6312]|uniref:hypothetical protein n=1 Tax=Synechococcus sp. (strain ATCC 27167 / PCC 6312) TaxID=195253 RepID=UPI00029F436F|nr:hypothetical protein [Synechococcus sp. PCC 6312]AFY62792.1 hypothetical protein Syn6312_3782 [Synechococcus sp. PCC 6312]
MKEELESIQGSIELLALGLHFYTTLNEPEAPGPILAAVSELDRLAYRLNCMVRFSQPTSEPSSQSQN